VLLIGALVWGGSTALALASTQTELATTAKNLSRTTSELSGSRAQASQLGAENGLLSADRAKLSSDVASMRNQLSKQVTCIAALTANATELQRISGLVTANFNRTAKGSAWAKADSNAIDYFYKAYSAAFDRRLSTANSWIAKGNAAIKTKNAQIKIIDAATKSIEAAESALATALVQSATTCGF
jgi:hypothetical protein